MFALVIVDDYSRYSEVYTLRSKDEVLSKFKEFIAQHCPEDTYPKSIMTDWGTEFMGDFRKFCVDKNIMMMKSCPYRAWQNGFIERANRTLATLARAMLIDSNLPPEFWGLALSHAAFVSNRACHSGAERTPYEQVTGVQPDLTDLRVWGCPVLVHIEKRYIPKDLAHPRSEPGIFVGYCDQSPSYLVYLPHRKRVAIRRDVDEFFEDRPGVLVGETILLPTIDEPLTVDLRYTNQLVQSGAL